MIAAARTTFRAQAQTSREGLRPGNIVIKLGSNTSSSLAVHVHIKTMTTVIDRHGQESRVEPCIVDVRKTLLPNWATQDAMTGKAKITTNSKTYKVSTVADEGDTLHLVCLRWPNDDD
jgi:hypothetical protein